MKKRWLIAAVAMLLAGIAVCGVSMAALGFDFKALATDAFETNIYPVAEKFDSISVEAETDQIRFLPAEDGKCTVECREMKNLTHEVAVKDGTLLVRTTDRRTWTQQIGVHIGSPAITIYLPEKAYGELSVRTDTGDVEIPADFTFVTLSIHGDTSDVECRASITGGLEIGLSTSDITLAALDAGALDLSVSTGRIQVDSVRCKGDVSIHVSTGKTLLNDLTCASLRTDGSTGDITLTDTVASGSFTIERSTGDVRFENADAQEITVKTSTGEVTGSLRSEKVFLTETDTGKQNVPKSVSGGRCEITTDTGDIEIEVP